ncbi:hypothetical protein [Sphingomonas sp. Mn802worker]|uniref:hypothetical protein n=1 Tax=Sphingomonas sp. Mn802worker TaxID=629773 RepID=UPI0012EA2410|nr:hypothetical protein [Sphingomonas sp. Mn802worker]
MLAFATSSAADAINLIVGLLGLALGVAGFGFTLHQLSQVKSVSHAQEEAITNLKLRFAGFDAIQECAQAQIYLDALRDAVQSLDKPSILANYDRLAICLLSLSESSSMPQDLAASLKDSASRIALLSNGIDKASASEISISKQLETARSFHTILMKTRFTIHKEQ